MEVASHPGNKDADSEDTPGPDEVAEYENTPAPEDGADAENTPAPDDGADCEDTVVSEGVAVSDDAVLVAGRETVLSAPATSEDIAPSEGTEQLVDTVDTMDTEVVLSLALCSPKPELRSGGRPTS